MSRLTALDPARLSAEQQPVHDGIVSGPRGRISDPLLALLHSPALASVVEKVGVYLRYETAVPARVRELAVLVVCGHWRCGYEWGSHAPLAIAAGVSAETVAGIGEGREPPAGADEDALIYRFAKSLLRDGAVGDEDYAAALRLLGEPGVVDLTAIVGYYTMLALAINAHEIPASPGARPPWLAQ